MKNQSKEIKELKEEIQKLKDEYPFRLSKLQIKGILFLILSYVTYSFAANISSLNVFTNGDVISAQSINDNFDYLEEKAKQNGELVAILKNTTQETIWVPATFTDVGSNLFETITVLDNTVLTTDGMTFTFTQAGLYKFLYSSNWSDYDTDLRLFNQTLSVSELYMYGGDPQERYLDIQANNVLRLQFENNMAGANSYDFYTGSFIYIYKIEVN